MDKVFENVLKRRGKTCGIGGKIQPSLGEGIDNKFINTNLNEPVLEYNKSRYRLISLSFESTSFHFCSVDPRDSQFLEDGTISASVSVYSASRYATRSCCIINSNLLTSFQPWISERILYIQSLSLIFLNKIHLFSPVRLVYRMLFADHRYLSWQKMYINTQ